MSEEKERKGPCGLVDGCGGEDCRDAATCAVPDCEFKATNSSDKCFCHTFGIDPPLTFEQYMDLDDEGLLRYRYRLDELSRMAALRKAGLL